MYLYSNISTMDSSRFTLALLLWAGFLISGLQGISKEDVQLVVPSPVLQGDTVSLLCLFSTHNTSIYSVQWYKGNREIFRYVPKEVPQKKIITPAFLTVDTANSDMNKLVLRDVPVGLTGNMSCEVTTETPTFKVITKEGYILVVVPPKEKPRVENAGGTAPPFNLSVVPTQMLKIRCKSGPSKPAANLTFFLNDDSQPLTKEVNIYNPVRAEYDLETREGEARIMLTHRNFKDNRIRVRCVASIFKIFTDVNEFSGDMLRKPSYSSVYNNLFGRGARLTSNSNYYIFSGKLVLSITTTWMGLRSLLVL